MVKLGGSVEFSDPVGTKHDAIVTAVWGNPESNPSVNLVYVSDDESETDQYGRQIKRNTSVVHESNQSAHGMFWREVT
jgi:hypothetical protein